ncbi:MAG TPA: cytochrome P450 [Kofleriaceae bacterium]|nr:cytochrome P450 [Kofleriaceae bacterium]
MATPTPSPLHKSPPTPQPAMPSPLLASVPTATSVPAVPGLPVLGNLLAFRRDQLALHDAAARTAPLARLQMVYLPVYVASSADLAHQILVEDAAAFKKSMGLKFLMPLLGDGLLTAEGEPHKRHRKLLAPAFAPRRLAAYGEVMVAETRAQLARWTPGRRIDLSHEMMELTLAIAGRTLFGADVRGDARTVAGGLELAQRAVRANLTSVVQLGYHWPLRRHVQMRRAVAALDEVVYRLIREGRRAGTDRGDVLSMLLLARDEAETAAEATAEATTGTAARGLTDREVRDEVMTLLLAGHETTANALTWTWYELGRNPGVLGQLEEELRRVVGPTGRDRPVTVEDLPSLPLNLAVIEEAMRLHPPAYVTGREALRDVELGGHTLPARSTVLVYIRGIHRRAEYFPDPLAFRPERMLPEAKKARPRHHYLPFGAGPRVCIGSHFALLEAQLCLATMVQHARLRVLATQVAPEPLVTLRPRGGLPAQVERAAL